MSAVRAPERLVRPPRERVLSTRRRRHRPRLRIVPRPVAKRRRWPFLLLSALLIGGLLVGIVAVQALVNQTSFKMRDLQAKTKVARQEYAQLRLDVADLSTPERIASQARLLGLRLPDARGVRVLPVAGATGWSLGGVDAPPHTGAGTAGTRP